MINLPGISLLKPCDTGDIICGGFAQLSTVEVTVCFTPSDETIEILKDLDWTHSSNYRKWYYEWWD